MEFQGAPAVGRYASIIYLVDNTRAEFSSLLYYYYSEQKYNAAQTFKVNLRPRNISNIRCTKGE